MDYYNFKKKISHAIIFLKFKSLLFIFKFYSLVIILLGIYLSNFSKFSEDSFFKDCGNI